MPLEIRARITLLLPQPTTRRQHRFIDLVVSNFIRICGGVTLTLKGLPTGLPSIFSGWWLDENQQIKGDAILLIFADAPVSLQSPALIAHLERLKLGCQRAFDQDIVWTTIHQVERIATHDFLRS